MPTNYQPDHRNPMFAGADCTFDYELALLLAHFHPTVALFAQQIFQV